MTRAGSRRIVVTGTDTDVGKTHVVAALAKALSADRVIKPVQSGLPADVDQINAMVGRDVAEDWHRIDPPLAPETAAFELELTLPPVEEYTSRLRDFDGTVIVEGSGGVLVRLDLEENTIVDLALAIDAEVVVVTRDTLGTLNHTGLTVEHLRSRGIEPVLVIGAAHSSEEGQRNQRELVRLTGCRVVGVVPVGSSDGAFDPDWLRA